MFRAIRRVKKDSEALLGSAGSQAVRHLFEHVQGRFEQLGGVDALEALQLSESQEVFESAQKMLLANFEEDLSALGSL